MCLQEITYRVRILRFFFVYLSLFYWMCMLAFNCRCCCCCDFIVVPHENRTCFGTQIHVNLWVSIEAIAIAADIKFHFNELISLSLFLIAHFLQPHKKILRSIICAPFMVVGWSMNWLKLPFFGHSGLLFFFPFERLEYRQNQPF